MEDASTEVENMSDFFNQSSNGQNIDYLSLIMYNPLPDYEM